MLPRTNIQNFYSDSAVFLTGGTGFLGKLILEKILRSCSDVKKVYLLVRTKKNETSQERFEKLFGSPAFKLVKEQHPNFRTKVELIDGDCMLPNLGLNQKNIELIQKNVNIIIHCAATIRFDEALKLATQINVKSTWDLMEIARKCKYLKAFVHVSTAYSNCNQRKIDEKFYKAPIKGKDLILLCESLDANIIDGVQKAVIQDWPNTYTLTKNVAEDLVREQAKDLPVIIVRPSIVVPASKEPLEGFIDQFYGPAGLVLAVSLGIVRVHKSKLSVKLNYIPVDYVANMIIASAWDVASTEKIPGYIKIVNCVNDHNKLRTERQHYENFKSICDLTAPVKGVWYPYLFQVENELYYRFLALFLHTGPAYIADVVSSLMGKQTKYLSLYKKVDKMVDVLEYFTTHEFKFEMTNGLKMFEKMSSEDRAIFNFDTKHFDIKEYFPVYMMGLRLYLAEDPIETLPKALEKRKLLRIYHYISIIVACLLFYFVTKFLLYILFGY